MGEVDVDALLDRMTPQQFDEWVAYETVEGFSNERILAVLAVGFSAMVNSWGGKTKPEQFLPKYERKKPDDSYELKAQEQQAALMRAFRGG